MASYHGKDYKVTVNRFKLLRARDQFGLSKQQSERQSAKTMHYIMHLVKVAFWMKTIQNSAITSFIRHNHNLSEKHGPTQHRKGEDRDR